MTDNTHNIDDDVKENDQTPELEDKFRTILKALDLLGCDLFEDIADPMTVKYFNGRINYLFRVAVQRNNELLTRSYLRSLYVLFSNYYIKYQSPLPGDDVSPADKERHLIYAEINDRLEDFQNEY